MFDEFARDTHLLWKANSLISRIWLNVLARRFGLFVFAGLISVIGLGMVSVAGFFALRASIGPVWAAAIVSTVDFVLAAIVTLFARNAGPGSEIELAFNIRKMAIDAIQADARDFKLDADAFGQEIRNAKDNIAAFVQDPLSAFAQKLLIPAAISIISELRSKKGQA